MAGFFLSMTASGLRELQHLPKQVRQGTKGQKVRRWLLVFFVIALIALAAGYYTFGGADMGR
jgi:hypothetical protein